MRWALVAMLIVVATGCAKSLEDLYPFRCPTDGAMTCPLGANAMCQANIGCTYTCSSTADCKGGDGKPRDDLACVNGFCAESCTDSDGNKDPGACADTYACVENSTATGNGLFTCYEL
jgi:hypothetical protein